MLHDKTDICNNSNRSIEKMFCSTRARKSISLVVLPAVLCLMLGAKAAAQYLPPRISIHVSNPLSLMSKAGVKLQYRLNENHSVVAGYRTYYGFFPGYQSSVEYHHYYRTWERSEAFFYGKFLYGNSVYSPKPYYTGWDATYIDPGAYGALGAGLGKRYNFGPFFIEANVGLKYTQILEKKSGINTNLFYTLGPGSLVDCGLQLGLQFFSEGRHMYYKTLAPRRRSRFRD